MSKYYERGSFRGVEFDYLNDDYIYQKKTAEDNLFADETDEEELGEKPRAFTLKCFVCGKEARKKRNDLIKALEKTDAGILVHPQYGRMKVKVPKDGFVVHSTAEQGNYYEFEINFIKANDKMTLTVLPVKPSAVESLKSVIAKAQETVAAAVEEKSWFDKAMDAVDGFADAISMSGIAADIAEFASNVTGKISRLTSLKLLPFDAITSITGSLTTLGRSAGSILNYPAKFVSDCLGVFSNITGTFDFFKSMAKIKTDFLPKKNKYATPSNRAKEKAQAAIVNLFSQVGTIKAVEYAALQAETGSAGNEAASSTETAESAEEDGALTELTAAEVKERIEAITELVEAVVDDEDNADNPEIQEVFEELLQKAVAVLNARQTLKTRSVSRAVSVPALVLLYEECGRSAVDKLPDFTSRNGLKTSLRIDGGQIVEVVDD